LIAVKAMLLILSVAAIGLVGCVSKKTARLESQAAFLAGQQQASQAVPTVLVRGDVANSVIPWREGLTLADALLASEYRGMWDPQAIVIHRQGQRMTVNVRNLLHGRDNPPLLPGDVIEVRR
jgi:hypothetical protein